MTEIDNDKKPDVTVSQLITIVSDLKADIARHQSILDGILVSIQNLEQLVPGASLEESRAILFPHRQPDDAEEKINFIPTPKTRSINAGQNPSTDIVARLRMTKFGNFYVNHLKQSFVRVIIIWLWRYAYGPYLRLTSIIDNKQVKQWRTLINLDDFTKSKGVEKIQLVSEEYVDTPKPKVFPERDQDYLVSPHDQYNFPPIYVAILNKGLIYGGTNLTLMEDVVICHDLFDCERDYTSEELHGRTLIDTKRKRIRWLLHDETPVSVPVAASFVDVCASNYAHWLTEVLPRIAVFCAEKQFYDVPIVVNDGLHKNIIDSLFLFAGNEHEIIFLPVGRALSVDKLYLTSVAGYVPFERRSKEFADHSHGVFSPRAFELIRNQVATFVEKLSEKSLPKKIYLRRNSGARKVTNSAELEALLVTQGYVIVDPEKLNFLTQVQLFSNAKIIVGSSGAAIANMIFCPFNTEIYIFISKNPDTSYWYWQNMARTSGKDVKYFLGDVTEKSNMGIHNDFIISSDELLKSPLIRSDF